ncbi:hypothetical protein FACS189450_08350 [Spirochaetia bacterium]|nr:hypothetical protein FACS189450_08350 [Spirochaetia bacterium]
MYEVAKKSRIRLFYFFMSLFSLLFGILIYATARNTNLVIYEWLGKPGFIALFSIPTGIKTTIHPIVLYNLPDGLWFLSGVLLIRSLWMAEKKWCIRYLAIFYMVSFVLEMLQLDRNIPGTFDVLDLFFMGSTAFAESILFYVFIRRRI